MGGNVNVLKPYSDMASLITVYEILRALQTRIIALSETNLEWPKFQPGDNIQKLFTKAFGAAIMEYSTTSDKFETTYHNPGGTTCGELGQVVHNIVDSGRDDTGHAIWYYLAYAAKEGKEVAILSAYRVCKQKTLGILLH
jgi:hypothetical protein